MLELYIAAALIVGLPALAWVIGSLHIRYMNPLDVGVLTPELYSKRLTVYGVPAAAFIGVLNAFESILSKLPQPLRVWFACLSAAFMLFGFLVLGLSYLEANWYNANDRHKNSLRGRIFRKWVLPILFSSTYLYWVTLIPAWVLLLSAIVRSQME